MVLFIQTRKNKKTMTESDSTQPEKTSTPTSIEVGMKEWAKSTLESPILKTRGLGPCIGIATYDPETGIGHLAHIAIPLFEQKSIDAFLQSVLAGATDDLKIWVRGGQRDPNMAETFDMPQMGRDMITAQLAALGLPEGNTDIEWDKSGMGAQSTRMSLDTQTGTFETSVAITDQGLRELGNLAMVEN
jgi:chemotaxis protein CheD